MELVKVNLVNEILDRVKDTSVLTKEDSNFLVENSKDLNEVYNGVHIWRTDFEKRSILNDNAHPTNHSKFHQAIAEQKVQFEQSIYLAKDFEMKKIEIEELELDLEELGDSKRDALKRRKINLEIQFKEFELKAMKVQMKYRISEVKGWKVILDDLKKVLEEEKLSNEEIWDKDSKELEWQFYRSLTRLQGLKNCTDGGERINLIAFAKFCYEQAEKTGMLEKLIGGCNPEQLDSLTFLRSGCLR